jgi:hypothetical protein
MVESNARLKHIDAIEEELKTGTESTRENHDAMLREAYFSIRGALLLKFF